MAQMPEKPRGKAPPPDPANEPGRLGTDDRGNVTWEWTAEPDLLADDTLGAAERVRALVDPSLVVVEDQDADLGNPLKRSGKGLKTGYNPYNSGALGKSQWKKKKNLKELSKWIELRKKIQEKQAGEE
jgi:hypothetical protein